MTFEDKIKSLAAKAEKTAHALETEEATKNALVMPFIASLGYDVFDPDEVIPEFTADVGIKKGEKVDYALRRNGEIVMLVEAKKSRAELDISHSSQLFRYFTVTKARIAVLTNGVVYRFFSDLEEPNKMDEKPFLELDLLNLRDNLIAEVAKLSKSQFDLDNMLATASDLKFMREIRAALEAQFEQPEEDFVRFFFQRANPNGRFMQSAKEHFSGLVKHTLAQLVSDRVSDRLRSALEREDASTRRSEEPVVAANKPETLPSEIEVASDGIETTQEELDGFQIIRAIVCDILQPERVSYRDSKTYFAIIVDGSNRKLLCRLHFNRARKYVGLLDDQKKETKVPIEDLQGIFGLRDQLRAAAQRWVNTTKEPEAGEPGA
ncbi:type I restriction endonuclease [Nannocystaceae bacterium ST9]